MATTSPDNIKTPNAGDQYALVQDLGALADTVQNAITRRANSFRGTSAQRIAFTTAPEGSTWQDTNGDQFPYVRLAGAWSRTGGQKILAQGNSYMIPGSPWNLSESIQSQPTGIVLIWSSYDTAGGTTQWSSDFIPKAAQAAIGNGFGWAFRPGLSGNVAKYLYVSNNSIAGYADNSVAPNNTQALRYVIGV